MEEKATPSQLSSLLSDGGTLSIQQILETAVQHHNSGRLTEAEAGYKQALKLAPSHPVALQLLGVLALQVGQNQVAVDLIKKAISVKPDYAVAHLNLGSALKALGHFDAAIASYKSALVINPNLVSAHFNLGNTYSGLELLEDAVTSYQGALALKPDYGEAYTNLGNALKKMGKQDDAVIAYGKTLALNPQFSEGHYNLGRALMDLGKLDEAVKSYQAALSINPNYVDALSNMGSALKDLGRMDEAIESYQKAIKINPEFAIAHSNLGTVFKDIWMLDEAVECYQRALVLKPDYAEAHSNLGNALKELGDLEGAIASYRCALSIDPDYADTSKNLGLALLLAGDYVNGWKAYAHEWQTKNKPVSPHFSDKPLWKGEPLKEEGSTPNSEPKSKKLLVWMEQGIGDEIMFASMIPDLKELVDDFVVECADRLLPLFERSFPTVNFIARQDDAPLDSIYGKYDLQIPAGSLGQLFRTDINQFPRKQHYIIPDRKMMVSFQSDYKQRWPGKILVGISWSSGDKTAGVKRSISLDKWLPILSNPNCHFINLQYGDVQSDLTALKNQTGVDIFFDAKVDPMLDMDTFAAQTAALDLVISIDNSTVHMSGALGVPTWIMLPCIPEWRWLLGRDDSVWYPSAHLYRQPERDAWEVVINRVGEDLKSYVVNDI